MTTNNSRAIAIVGLGCVLPDAPNPTVFWNNLVDKRYSITEVPPERWSVKDYYDPDPSAPVRTADPANLPHLRIGDTVLVTYTEALAISLEKLGKSPV